MPGQLLTPNSPFSRFKYVAKMYGERYPEVVLRTFFLLSDTVGIEHPEREFKFARRYDVFAQSPSHEAARDLVAQALDELKDDPRMKRGRGSDPLWPWIAQQLAQEWKEGLALEPRPTTMVYRALVGRLVGKGPALALWQRANRIDLGQWSIYEALEALEEFEVETKGVPQGDVVFEFSDGWTVQQLESEDQLDAEGEAMQHCVGSYYGSVEVGRIEIFSLRDPKGRPHVTIEFDPDLKIIRQVRGKQNDDPAPEYQERVDEFLASDALPKMEPYVKEIYDELNRQTDDEEIGNLVHEWIDTFGNDALSWIKVGFDHSPREAEMLRDLGVMPEDVGDWPPVAWSWWNNNYDGDAKRVEDFVRLIQVATRIPSIDREHRASGAAREFAKQISLPFEEEPPPRSEWDWDWQYVHDDEQVEWEPILAEAERWAATDLDLDDVVAWYREFFLPGTAKKWEGIDVAPTIASALRAQRVTPEQVARAVEDDRIVAGYPSYDLNDVDKILQAVGVVAPNRRRTR